MPVFRILFCLAFLLAGAPASAAEIGLRPDLGSRLIGLKPVYEPGAGPVIDTRTWRGTDWREGIVLIAGPIVPGDLDRLEAVIGPGGDPLISPPFHVVFDSPGGNLAEAVRIGEYLRGWRGGNAGPSLGGVFVLEGSECLSACAIAFALAALDRDKGQMERFVEVGARLGFHMPFLPPDMAERTATMADAMDFTYDVVDEYLKLIENGQTPIALAQNALHYRGAEEFFLLTGGLMTRPMGFDPVSGGAFSHPVSHDGLLERDYVDACRILAFTVEGGLDEAGYEWWGIDETDCTWGRIGHSHEGTMAEILRDRPLTAGLLGDVLGCHGGGLTTRYHLWDARNRFLDEEKPAEYGDYTRRYAEYHGTEFVFPHQMDWSRSLLAQVNLREAPGLEGARLASLPEGAGLRVTDCRVLADPEGVWFEVETGAGRGWVSARYVSRLDRNALDWPNTVLRPAQD